MDSPAGSARHASSNKRPPKGFRACWECKKRKMQSNSSQRDQELPHSLNTLYPPRVDEQNTCSMHIGERLSKLEQLFEKFVCRKPPHQAASSSDAPLSLKSTSSNEKPYHFGFRKSISDDDRSTADGRPLAAQHSKWTSAPSIRTLAEKDNGMPNDSDTVKQSLVALLPSQADADLIFESSNGWTILGSLYSPPKQLFVNEDPQSYALNISAIAEDCCVIIARTLLHLAICISSLPPEFDEARLSGLESLETTVENYVMTVTTLVTSSDEQMSTLYGLETLWLLAVYYMNAANLRQSWLIIRRAMNIAHLMGFHRIIRQPPTSPPIEAVESSKRLWRGFVDLDRYLGLHLRLPFAAEDYPVPHDADLHLIHRCKIAAICRQITELDREVSPQTYSQALALDERLESLMRELPKEFWDVPNVPPTARTAESHAALERIMVQMWHFELKTMIHLPFLIRAPQESRYEYSKVTALQSSRNIVMRWFALRNSGITQACCRLAELGVYIAAVTITLDILIDMATKEKSEVQKTKGSDFAMICRLIGEMEQLAKSSRREKIAGRSADAIKKMLSSLDPSRPRGKIKLTIPYFGIVDIEAKRLPERPGFDLDSDTAKKFNTPVAGPHLPVFSFVSNALWPPADEELDFDIVLFDGLEDRDTEGNWVF